MKNLLVLLILISLTICDVAAQYSGAEFKDLVGKARSGVKETVIEYNIKNFEPLGFFKTDESGAILVELNSWGPNNSTTTVKTFKTVAIVKNTGDQYQYFCSSQEVDPNIYEEVMDRKFVTVGQKALLKGVKKSNVEFGREGNRHTITASGSLLDKEKDIVADLTLLLHISRGLLHNIAWEVNNVNKKK